MHDGLAVVHCDYSIDVCENTCSPGRCGSIQVYPTPLPTIEPTYPTAYPTDIPTPIPTIPTMEPTIEPTVLPTATPINESAKENSGNMNQFTFGVIIGIMLMAIIVLMIVCIGILYRRSIKSNQSSVEKDLGYLKMDDNRYEDDANL